MESVADVIARVVGYFVMMCAVVFCGCLVIGALCEATLWLMDKISAKFISGNDHD